MNKHYLFLFVGLIVVSTLTYSQCSIRTITTAWNQPNTNNSWNWTTPFFDNAYIKNRSSTTIPSPFFNPNATFQNPNLIFLQSPATKDCLPEDGWELLVKDFGNGSNLPSTAVTNPFFALYNRYTATIRAFFMVVDPLSGTNNGATVSLMFEGGTGHIETALMAYAKPIMNAVDRFDKGVIVRTPNKYSNEYDYWLFADFPVAYDPCTCLFSSQLTFTIQLIQTTNASLAIKLKGTTTGTLKEVIKPSPDGVQTNTLSNSALDWVNNAVSSGVEGYKTWQSFKTAGDGIADFLMSTNPDQKDKLKNELSDLLNFTQAVPYLNGALGVLNFLIGGGKKAAKSAGPTTYTANLTHEISGSADGKLELSTVRGYRTINTSGANSSGSSSGIPTYDNVLGVLTLMETPRVEYLEYVRDPASEIPVVAFPNPSYDPNCQPTPEDPYACDGNLPYSTSHTLANYDFRVVQYKLVSPIKYAVNAAAKMNLIDIKAAIVVDRELDPPYNSLNNWVYPSTFGNVNPYNNENEKMNNMGYEFETDTRYRTPFLPLSCLSNTSISACLRNSLGAPYVYPKAIYLKIKAVLRRQDADPNTQDVIFLATYKTQVARSAQDPNNLLFKIIATNRTGPDGFYNTEPFEYPNTWYHSPSQIIYPLPMAGIAGVQNPAYPSQCAASVPPQTDQEITAFCNNSSLYKPASNARISLQDAYREKEVTKSEDIELVKLNNYPNPFDKQTVVKFDLPKSSTTRLSLYDQNGKLIKVLLNSYISAGKHSVTFIRGNIQSGVYYYVLQTDYIKTTGKMFIK